MGPIPKHRMRGDSAQAGVRENAIPNGNITFGNCDGCMETKCQSNRTALEPKGREGRQEQSQHSFEVEKASQQLATQRMDSTPTT